MAVKKQPESEAETISEAANDWFRQFLRILELSFVEEAHALSPDASPADYRLAAMRAVKLTLFDSGADQDAITALFAQVALEDARSRTNIEWNADLNKRRFELIDGDIQGTLSRAEQLELAGLTQLMREHVDTDVNVPLEGARKLHRLLANSKMESRTPNQ